MTDIDLKDWQAENLRLSVFMVDPIDPLQTRSWERLVGSVPDDEFIENTGDKVFRKPLTCHLQGSSLEVRPSTRAYTKLSGRVR